jgi:hypothetical protein
MRLLIAVIRMTLILAGCAAALSLGAAACEGNAQSTKPAAAPAAAPATAPSAAELDKLLAPIALYPDTLLAQMLLCAANPGKIAALSEWLVSHPNEKGSALQDAATKAGFEASFVALVLFPDVVSAMASRIDWTTQLGKAFAADNSAVFASIQRLRGKAQQAGKLKDSPQQNVETKTTSNGQQVIVIEPSNPQVVYVPQYNPEVVYTTQPTTVVVQESSSSADAVAAGLIGFTAGIAIGAAFDNDYYYGPYGWGRPVYMYNDAWNDWYDDREDAREDWMEHREDIVEDRGERARDTQEQRTERAETRQENRPETQAQRTERQQTRQENRPETQAQRDQRRTDAQAAASSARSTADSRGYSGGSTTTQRAAPDRSGTKSDAFSGYSSGKSQRAASQRGQSSRSSSRSSGGRRR